MGGQSEAEGGGTTIKEDGCSVRRAMTDATNLLRVLTKHREFRRAWRSSTRWLPGAVQPYAEEYVW